MLSPRRYVRNGSDCHHNRRHRRGHRYQIARHHFPRKNQSDHLKEIM